MSSDPLQDPCLAGNLISLQYMSFPFMRSDMRSDIIAFWARDPNANRVKATTKADECGTSISRLIKSKMMYLSEVMFVHPALASKPVHFSDLSCLSCILEFWVNFQMVLPYRVFLVGRRREA